MPNAVDLACAENVFGAGLNVHVIKETVTESLDDMSDGQELGRQVHGGILTLFHDDGREILISTETSRPSVHERADKRKKKPNVEPMTSMLTICW